MKRREFLLTGAAVTLVATGLHSGPAFADDPVITIKGARMIPDTLTVKKGQSITIIDKDNTSHSIYSESPGMEFQLKMAPGSSGTFKFTVTGAATVECAEHPTEIGKITIV